MSRLIIYTRLRLKTVLRIFPAMCVMTLLLCLSLGGMLYLQSLHTADVSQQSEDELIDIGIVGVESSGYLSALFPMVQNLDSSRTEVNFIRYQDRKSASDAIRSGEISAAVVIPDGLVDALLAGENGRMTLLFPSSSAGINALLVREVSGAVSSVIGSIETGGFVLADYYTASGMDDPDVIADAQTSLLLAGIQDIMHRSSMFRVKYVKAQTQLSIECFYLISMITLLILLLGVMCAGSFIRSDHSLGRLLRVRGLGSLRQVAAEYISLVFLLVCLCAIFFPLIAVALSHMPISFSAFGITGKPFISGFLRYSVRTFPVILLAASIDMLIYELSQSLITGVLMQFLTMIALSYASGIFYTVSTMPEVMKKISSRLPTGQALLYLQLEAKHTPGSSYYLCLVLVWTAAFLLCTVLIRSRKLSGKGGAA